MCSSETIVQTMDFPGLLIEISKRMNFSVGDLASYDMSTIVTRRPTNGEEESVCSSDCGEMGREVRPA